MKASGYPVPVSDLSGGILEPVLRKRTGMSIALVQSWDEIVGERLAAMARPERILWPRRHDDSDPFEPATLVIACSAAAALRIQHESAEIVGRLNAFLGYGAIGRLKIIQKPVLPNARPRPSPRKATAEEAGKIDALVGGVGNEALRDSLRKLGEGVLTARRKA